MEKIYINDDYLNSKSLIYSGTNSNIYKLNNFEVLKEFKINEEDYSNETFNNIVELKYKKLILLENKNNIDEIIKPNKLVFKNNKFIGYIMDKVNDTNMVDYLTKKGDNLNSIAKFFYELEKIVKKANNNEIIIPDLATDTNIKCNNLGNDIRLIDVDGMQINNIYSYEISSTINNGINDICTTKKYYNGKYFNKNIDKLSLLINFIFYCTNINLCALPYIEYCLPNIIKSLGINDENIKRKITKLFSPDLENEYMDENILEFANNYKIGTYHDDIKYFIKK